MATGGASAQTAAARIEAVQRETLDCYRLAADFYRELLRDKVEADLATRPLIRPRYRRPCSSTLRSAHGTASSRSSGIGSPLAIERP
jgi:hypothetical protein